MKGFQVSEYNIFKTLDKAMQVICKVPSLFFKHQKKGPANMSCLEVQAFKVCKPY